MKTALSTRRAVATFATFAAGIAVAAVGPATGAAAQTNDSTVPVAAAAVEAPPGYHFISYYPGLAACLDAGNRGVQSGQWRTYVCVPNPLLRFTWHGLYVKP